MSNEKRFSVYLPTYDATLEGDYGDIGTAVIVGRQFKPSVVFRGRQHDGGTPVTDVGPVGGLEFLEETARREFYGEVS